MTQSPGSETEPGDPTLTAHKAAIAVTNPAQTAPPVPGVLSSLHHNSHSFM